jgi:hypothetical protein
MHGTIGSGLEDSELGGQVSRDGDRSHRDIGISIVMKFHHACDVHTVNVISPEDGHCAFAEVIDQVKILEYRVRRPAVPTVFPSLPFGRRWNDELAFQEPAELPTVAQVFQQGLASVLNHDIDGEDPGVDQIAQDEVHDAVLSAEWHGGFGTVPCKREQAIALPTCKHKCYDFVRHRLLLRVGQAGSDKASQSPQRIALPSAISH